MTEEIPIVCESCGQQAPDSEKLCPWCGGILESKAWQNIEMKTSRLQMLASWLKFIFLVVLGLIAGFFLAWVACLVILALIFGSLAFLTTLVRRTNATYGYMIMNAQRNGVGGALLLLGVIIAILLLLFGAQRFWQKRPPK
jgi:hypothetical protein